MVPRPSDERNPNDRGPRPRRRSGAPEVPRGDRRMIPLAGSTFHVEAFPWTGGLLLWTQDDQGRWVRVPIRS